MGERLVPLSRTKLIRRFKDLGWNGTRLVFTVGGDNDGAIAIQETERRG